jgi:Mg2+-importing ATPase
MGTLTSGSMKLVSATDPRGDKSGDVSILGAVAAHLHSGVQTPLDEALRASTEPPRDWEKLDEIPFDFERRRMSVVARHDGRAMVVVMGAPEAVVAACTSVRDASQVTQLTEAMAGDLLAFARRDGEAGLRTLALASREIGGDTVINRDAEHDLTLEGWLAFADPPLADTAAAVAALAKDGVQLKILTGDDDAVARHVCAATGVDASQLVLGSELDQISNAAMGPVADRTTVFARISSQQKLRVLLALKSRGHVVGYLGDGINDAPSLHAADVGISVAGAVDVAKDAADIVLLDRRLDVLHTGIIEGRKAFGNVMKYLLMGTSSNFGNMFSMAVASIIVPFLPMLPTQILLNNFLYDLSQVAIPSDRVDDEYLRKPHRWNIGLLRRFMIRIGLVSSLFDFITFAVLLMLFRSTPPAFRTGWFVESLMTQTLVLFVIRTTGNPFHSRPSALLAMTVCGTVLVGLANPFMPFAGVLGFVSPPATFLLFVAVVTATYLSAVELTKRRLVPDLMR